LSACITCSAGKYSTAVGLSASGCTDCAVGTFSDATGATACLVCTPLDNGEYTSPGTSVDSCEYTCNSGYTVGWNESLCVAVPPVEGVIRTPRIGEYCFNYFNSLWKYASSESLHRFCYGQSCGYEFGGQCCPWNEGASCFSSYSAFVNSVGLDFYDFNCNAGCVDTAPCTALENGVYIGSGTNAGNCPFQCNEGYVPSENLNAQSCVVGCPAGKYLNGTKCEICSAGTFTSAASQVTACTTCSTAFYSNFTGATACLACTPCASPDQFLMGCGGASAGVCAYCDNSS
jgi:hypothetical protein